MPQQSERLSDDFDGNQLRQILKDNGVYNEKEPEFVHEPVSAPPKLEENHDDQFFPEESSGDIKE